MGQKQELLAKLRAAKEAKYLSYQDIVDITEENGEAVSLSTVKRVFQKDSDLEDFRYNQTIRPIIRAVLGMDEETEPPKEESTPEQAEQYYTTIEAMKSVIDFKHTQITEQAAEITRLKAELQTIRDQRKEDIDRIETSDQRKVDYLKKIIDDLQTASKWYKKVILILGLVVIAVIIALIIDLSIGHIGWIRY